MLKAVLEQERANLAAERSKVAELADRYARLREAFAVLKKEYELLKRKLFAAKAERVDTAQLELEFAGKHAELEALMKQRDELFPEFPPAPNTGDTCSQTPDQAPGQTPDKTPDKTPAPKPPSRHPPKNSGRRAIDELNLPQERIELPDPILEGRAERIGFEESFLIAYRPGSFVRIVLARAKYRVELGLEGELTFTQTPGPWQASVPTQSVESSSSDAQTQATVPTQSVESSPSEAQTQATVPSQNPAPSQGLAQSRAPALSQTASRPQVSIVTAPLPKKLMPGSLCTPSLLAKLMVDKFCDGLPFHRQEERLARDGFRLNRSLMCRWAEECGTSLYGIVAAMKKESLSAAFCIATDATGIAIQPEASPDGKRQACRKGHFFTFIADKDHIWFEFTPHETSEAVQKMLQGFHGYIQADAKSVYNLLFQTDTRSLAQLKQDPDGPPEKPEEVGCWSHCRRKFYETAVGKDEVARDALFQIHKLFENERKWAHERPAKRTLWRQQFSKPLLDGFFEWVEREFEKVQDQRGPLRSALGYARNHREALCRFLNDGRLVLDNNRSERALRAVAVGRKAWLFVGSDIHAKGVANFLSVIASAKLHGLNPEQYLRDIFRVLPYWPRDRFLELAPKYWAATRDRLSQDELALEVGPLSVPPRQ